MHLTGTGGIWCWYWRRSDRMSDALGRLRPSGAQTVNIGEVAVGFEGKVSDRNARPVCVQRPATGKWFMSGCEWLAKKHTFLT